VPGKNRLIINKIAATAGLARVEIVNLGRLTGSETDSLLTLNV
jgi:hypothetical protein